MGGREPSGAARPDGKVRHMPTKQPRLLALLVVVLTLLAACNGPTKTPDAGVEITSPEDGATITGDRSITVTVTLTDATADATVTAQVNGVDATPTRVGATVTFPATLKDDANTLSVSVQNPGQAAPATATANVVYPFLTFVDGQAASFAIGQPDLVSVTETAANKRLGEVYGRGVVVNGALYIAEYGAGRVMGYDQVPTASDATADFVLGKADFTDIASATSATAMAGPGTIATDGQRLFVADYENHRVLVYSAAPTVSGAAATLAIGQPDLDSDLTACSRAGLNYPDGVTYAAGRLIVADSGNNRVLIWNTVPTDSGVAPDVVLGQGAFDTCQSNDDDQDGISDAAPSNRVLNYPSDVWSDGERLVVADASNNRVLIWNQVPTTDFAAADAVLGQPGFHSDSPGNGQLGLDSPSYVHSNGNQLFVADSANRRVLIWDSLPESSGLPANQVLGQPDFDTTERNAGQPSVNAAGFVYADGVFVYENQLFVADSGNARVLVFDPVGP